MPSFRRHPMYASALLYLASAPSLALARIWGLIPIGGDPALVVCAAPDRSASSARYTAVVTRSTRGGGPLPTGAVRVVVSAPRRRSDRGVLRPFRPRIGLKQRRRAPRGRNPTEAEARRQAHAGRLWPDHDGAVILDAIRGRPVGVFRWPACSLSRRSREHRAARADDRRQHEHVTRNHARSPRDRPAGVEFCCLPERSSVETREPSRSTHNGGRGCLGRAVGV
jgi:hypothetical protein